jgi:hypothetical protein
MKPGRELDALVAEKVMGFTWQSVPWLNQEQKCLAPPFKPLNEENTTVGDHIYKQVPHYSTDIAAAWEVLLTRFSFHFRDYEDGGGSVGVDWTVGRCEPGSKLIFCEIEMWNGDGYERIIEKAETEAHAICLAALKAVGVEIPAD